MMPDEKKASAAIQDVIGIEDTNAQAILSVIGTNMERFPTDAHITCPSQSMLAAIYHILKENVVLRDLGAE